MREEAAPREEEAAPGRDGAGSETRLEGRFEL